MVARSMATSHLDISISSALSLRLLSNVSVSRLLKVVLDSCSTSTMTKLKPPPSESDFAGAIDAIKLCLTQYPVLEPR